MSTSEAKSSLSSSAPSTQDALLILRETLRSPSRQPQVILHCASHIVKNASGSVSELELCAIREQLVIAALDCGEMELASRECNILTKKFGRGSIRVRRLHGMLLEANGQTEESVKVYKRILKESPAEAFVAKRLASAYRAEGDFGEAIRALEQKPIYRDAVEEKEFSVRQLQPLDESCVRELASLHWAAYSLDRAVFFAEELTLFDPTSFLNFVRLGECLYANKDLERAATAYSQSLRLHRGRTNLRGAMGLLMTSAELMRISASKRKPGSDESSYGGTASRNASELHTFAKNEIQKIYALPGASHASVAEKALAIAAKSKAQ